MLQTSALAPDPALALAAALLLFVAVALTAFGARQPRYEGWNGWRHALWLAAAGVLLLAWGAPAGVSGAATLGSLLLLALPWLTLRGLRRFHPRQAWPGNAALDAAALVGALVLRVVAELVPPVASGLMVAAAALAAHSLVALVLWQGPGGRDLAPARALASVIGMAGVAPLLATATGLATPGWAQAVAAAVLALALAFAAITLVCERTERQLRDSRRRLRVLANLDSLTQVPNRRHFEELAERALLGDEPGSATLLQIDLDHFKRINDLFGHAAGDRALQLVSQAMLEQLRAHDVPGRQGGDEFVLLLRRSTPEQAMAVAQRIVAAVQRRAPGRQLPTLSLSVGIVQVGFGESVGAALRRADQALYEAKRQGRGRAVTAEGQEESPVFGESRPMGLAA
jgi:diguanylate cyclase